MNERKMYKAEISVVIFKILGVWPSSECAQGCLVIYNVYTIFIAFILVVFITSNTLYVLKENSETDDYKENFFYFVAVITSCLKLLVIYRKRDKIQKIMKRLDCKQFQPRDSEEVFIQSKFDKLARFLF